MFRSSDSELRRLLAGKRARSLETCEPTMAATAAANTNQKVRMRDV